MSTDRPDGSGSDERDDNGPRRSRRKADRDSKGSVEAPWERDEGLSGSHPSLRAPWDRDEAGTGRQRRYTPPDEASLSAAYRSAQAARSGSSPRGAVRSESGSLLSAMSQAVETGNAARTTTSLSGAYGTVEPPPRPSWQVESGVQPAPKQSSSGTTTRETRSEGNPFRQSAGNPFHRADQAESARFEQNDGGEATRDLPAHLREGPAQRSQDTAQPPASSTALPAGFRTEETSELPAGGDLRHRPERSSPAGNPVVAQQPQRPSHYSGPTRMAVDSSAEVVLTEVVAEPPPRTSPPRAANEQDGWSEASPADFFHDEATRGLDDRPAPPSGWDDGTVPSFDDAETVIPHRANRAASFGTEQPGGGRTRRGAYSAAQQVLDTSGSLPVAPSAPPPGPGPRDRGFEDARATRPSAEPAWSDAPTALGDAPSVAAPNQTMFEDAHFTRSPQGGDDYGDIPTAFGASATEAFGEHYAAAHGEATQFRGQAPGAGTEPGLAGSTSDPGLPPSGEAPRRGEPLDIPGYNLLRMLGKGGMGEVYLAERTTAAGVTVRCVIKTILEARGLDGRLRELFLDEARICSQLRHPNVVTIMDVGATSGRLYIAMEWVDGIDALDLVRYMNSHRRDVPLRHVLYIVRETLQGLHHAHTAVGHDGRPLGIVHRDISPGNVLISRQGAVKLADFGVAVGRAARGDARRVSMAGKPHYFAPELWRGDEASVRSDLFALGVTFYELLTSRPLFERGGSIVDVAERIMSFDVEQLLEEDLTLPDGLEPILRRALAHAPGDRYGSALDFLEDVSDFAYETGIRLLDAHFARYVQDSLEMMGR